MKLFLALIFVSAAIQAEESDQIGRYQVAGVGLDVLILVDTTNGHIWSAEVAGEETPHWKSVLGPVTGK